MFLKLEEIIRQNLYTRLCGFTELCFFAYRRIISLKPRLTKAKPLSFGLKTVINCFYGFAAVLTVQQEIITHLGLFRYKAALTFCGCCFSVVGAIHESPLNLVNYILGDSWIAPTSIIVLAVQFVTPRRPYNQTKRIGKLACQRASADCSASVLRKAKQSA